MCLQSGQEHENQRRWANASKPKPCRKVQKEKPDDPSQAFEEGLSPNAKAFVRRFPDGPFILRVSNAMVWDLFASRESLTDEMSKLIDERVKEAATA